MKPIARRSIPKKISTVPRQKTEAADYLELYQLAIEKKRLNQELETIEQRRQQIQQRLAELQDTMNQLQGGVQQSGTGTHQVPQGTGGEESKTYQTFTLDY